MKDRRLCNTALRCRDAHTQYRFVYRAIIDRIRSIKHEAMGKERAGRNRRCFVGATETKHHAAREAASEVRIRLATNEYIARRASGVATTLLHRTTLTSESARPTYPQQRATLWHMQCSRAISKSSLAWKVLAPKNFRHNRRIGLPQQQLITGRHRFSCSRSFSCSATASVNMEVCTLCQNLVSAANG